MNKILRSAFLKIIKLTDMPRAISLHVKRKIQKFKRLVIIGSAHKVGSTWLYRLVKDSCCLKKYVIPKYIVKSNAQYLYVDIELDKILSNIQLPYGGYIHKTHSFPISIEFANELPSWIKFVTIIRDPRDILVSASFYLSWLPQDKGGWGKSFHNLKPVDRIIYLIENGYFLRELLWAWFRCPYAYKMRYELLLSDTLFQLQKLFHYLEIGVSQDIISKVVNRYSFKRMSGRSPGQENKESFLRKGIAGDWKNYFNSKVKECFRYSCNGDWQRLLVEMGYEKNEDWLKSSEIKINYAQEN